MADADGALRALHHTRSMQRCARASRDHLANIAR